MGNGTSSFVKELDKLNEVIVDVLNKSLRPYITDIKYEFENYKEDIDKNIISCRPQNNFTYQNEIMNYSFILPGKKELPDLKLKIVGKDPINLIVTNVSFENFIKLEYGDEMTKMIVGKALNNNEEFKKDEKKEIEFAKKYQILSKNTSLFAEIKNKESQQDKLIKVELKEFNVKEEVPSYSYNSYSFLNSSIKKVDIENYEDEPESSNKKSSGNNFLGNITNKIKGIFSSFGSKKSKRSSGHMVYSTEDDDDYIEDKIMGKYDDHDDDYNNNCVNINDTSLIMSQDVIEGFWDENNETKEIIKIITSKVFKKIKKKIISL